MFMLGFPLLLIPFAIYNIIAFLMRDVSFAAPLFTLPLTSGTAWPVTLSDMLLALGILLLLLEVIKGARPGAKFLMDHLLSLLVFCGAAAEFVLLPQFGTSTYFLLALLALVDFLSGIALRARRGMQVTSGAAAARREVSPAPAAARQPPEFAPAPAVPAAASVAESVLLDHPRPTLTHPEVASNAPSPEVSSPELQPGEGSPPRDASPH
ncbi:MAG TPA: hypothetical protein VIL86_15480 [Tepidisphaeraceae bacterium]